MLKISNIIEELEKIKKSHGDLNVVCYEREYGSYNKINFENLDFSIDNYTNNREPQLLLNGYHHNWNKPQVYLDDVIKKYFPNIDGEQLEYIYNNILDRSNDIETIESDLKHLKDAGIKKYMKEIEKASEKEVDNIFS